MLSVHCTIISNGHSRVLSEDECTLPVRPENDVEPSSEADDNGVICSVEKGHENSLPVRQDRKAHRRRVIDDVDSDSNAPCSVAKGNENSLLERKDMKRHKRCVIDDVTPILMHSFVS